MVLFLTNNILPGVLFADATCIIEKLEHGGEESEEGKKESKAYEMDDYLLAYNQNLRFCENFPKTFYNKTNIIQVHYLDIPYPPPDQI